MRTRKPWVRARRILEAWYVRFMVASLLYRFCNVLAVEAPWQCVVDLVHPAQACAGKPGITPSSDDQVNETRIFNPLTKG
jgi:hypothetical protein